ncbi:hypothetical protein RSK20926_13729 [Roseobacter sp. SK209-2-6]|nr:hypothetical protein RSK20926_13729 [Roseobacter sp. SK209-2-6]
MIPSNRHGPNKQRLKAAISVGEPVSKNAANQIQTGLSFFEVIDG